MVHLFTSFTYNDPCQLVKAGRAFNPKIQKISYIYKYKYQLLKSWCLLLFFRFTYHISKTPIPLEKVGWGISFIFDLLFWFCTKEADKLIEITKNVIQFRITLLNNNGYVIVNFFISNNWNLNTKPISFIEFVEPSYKVNENWGELS